MKIPRDTAVPNGYLLSEPDYTIWDFEVGNGHERRLSGSLLMYDWLKEHSVAAYAAIVATGNLLWTIYQSRKDRATIKLRYQTGMSVLNNPLYNAAEVGQEACSPDIQNGRTAKGFCPTTCFPSPNPLSSRRPT